MEYNLTLEKTHVTFEVDGVKTIIPLELYYKLRKDAFEFEFKDLLSQINGRYVDYDEEEIIQEFVEKWSPK